MVMKLKRKLGKEPIEEIEEEYDEEDDEEYEEVPTPVKKKIVKKKVSQPTQSIPNTEEQSPQEQIMEMLEWCVQSIKVIDSRLTFIEAERYRSRGL